MSDDSDTVTAPPPPTKYRQMKGDPGADWQLTATMGKGGVLLSIPKSTKLQNEEAWEKMKYILAAVAVVGVIYLFSGRKREGLAPTVPGKK